MLHRLFLSGILLCGCFAAAPAQSTPAIVTRVCTEPVYTNGVQIAYRAYFGYVNNTANEIFIPVGPNNYFSPDPFGNYIGQPIRFQPGIHERVDSLSIPLNAATSWILSGSQTPINNSPALRCGQMTYQGRLSDGASAATGSYDLEFEFYDTAANGSPQSAKFVMEDVAVTLTDVFTVQFEVGATFISQNLDPRFLQIGVRPGATNGAFTILAPRQPIASAPYAMAAQTAVNAANATNATNFSGSLSGDVGGTQTGTVIQPNSVTASKIASNQVVKSINGLKDSVTIAGGSGITVTPGGNTLTLSLTATPLRKFTNSFTIANPTQADFLHNLGTKDITVQVYRQNGQNWDQISISSGLNAEGSVRILDDNSIRIAVFSGGTYRFVVIG